MRALARSFVLFAPPLLALSSCGGEGKQDRPAIVAFFPAAGQVLGSWLDSVRVTFDERVRVLNRRAVRLDDEDSGESIPCEAYADPSDARSILVKPVAGGHFFENAVHRVSIQEGAVVNDEDHYLLDEQSWTFTVGAAPRLVVTSSSGSAYEIDAATGALVSTTPPPAGFEAREPFGTDGRIWVWLDPVPGPGDSELATFVPGDAAMTTVSLEGEVGVREGISFAVSTDGGTLYATAVDQGRNRVRLHRIDVAARMEFLPPIELTPVLGGSPASFRPAHDPLRNRLYVPCSDGLGNGNLAFVDLIAFVELDAGPAPGVDALPTPDGAGDCAFEPLDEVIVMLLENASSPGFVLIGPESLEQFPAFEIDVQGTPRSLFVVPTARYVVQGLDGYDATLGIERSEFGDIGEGFALPVLDDVGGALQGSDRVTVMVQDLLTTRFHLFASDGVESWLLDYEWDTADVEQIDLDTVTPGTQAIALVAAVPGIVTGAAYPLGARAP